MLAMYGMYFMNRKVLAIAIAGYSIMYNILSNTVRDALQTLYYGVPTL